ncbi:hypothetical protein PM082_023739 [Marasmius tenuissimus]|nr:hypothetical protein PM082_023739 [Marasmius tenuissimus]
MSWASQLSHTYPDQPRWLSQLMFVECANFDCENRTRLLCATCLAVRYCSLDCRSQHLPFHIWKCRTPIHTGHYLVRASQCNPAVIPSHRKTRTDYGFDKAGKNAHLLLRLYTGLLEINPHITADILDEWRTQGVLCSRIRSTYSSAPLERRGDAYTWFLRNPWVLDPSLTPVGETIEARCERVLKVAWSHMGRDWSVTHPLSSWPDKKRECLWHYSVVLSGEHYSSFIDIWAHTRCTNVWTFAGYCADHDDGRTVAQLYRKLFEQCPFHEYLTAYMNRTAYLLMEKYRIFSQLPHVAVPRYFSFVLEQGDLDTIPSVWLLKQNLLMGDTWPREFVGADYGFNNCTSEDERSALADAYLAAFRAREFDEMELASELRRGRTFDYVSKFVPILREGEKMSRLMRRNNRYPWFRAEGRLWYWIYHLGWLIHPVGWGLIGWGASRLVRFIARRTMACVGPKVPAIASTISNVSDIDPSMELPNYFYLI